MELCRVITKRRGEGRKEKKKKRYNKEEERRNLGGMVGKVGKNRCNDETEEAEFENSRRIADIRYTRSWRSDRGFNG